MKIKKCKMCLNEVFEEEIVALSKYTKYKCLKICNKCLHMDIVCIYDLLKEHNNIM